MTDSSAIELKEDVVVVASEPDPAVKSRKRIGATIGMASFIGIIVIVIIVTVLTIKSPESEISPIKSSRKLDCLPKSRVQSTKNDKKLCEDKKCVYDLKSVSDGSPACYYNIDSLKYKLVNQIDTKLGVKYRIENIQSKYNVDVEFEFLSEDVFRFKVKKKKKMIKWPILFCFFSS
jgi:hypothetical protein